MEDFNECIDKCGLLELPVLESWAQLDRTLVNEEVLCEFPEASMKYMSRTSFGHRPKTINLQKKYALYGPTPFRFQRMWCEHEGFLPLVEAAWRLGDSGLMLGGLEKLMAKLKATKKALKLWNKEIFGRVDNVILELEERVEALDSRLQDAFSNEAEQEYLSSKIELEEWQRREEIRLSQLAKKKWLSDGDNNSKFYHAVVSQRRRNQSYIR
ncbi:uncharacterized protein LOC111386798 [Olea europaea var. sylvestris]|uniref:uncharacterized protein LOC111386798 n=1 Tax=Olea europaea var. sylvestris TaxID=158386 RepID=UPI000C1D3AF9|nr:uncharacterized protein LOC111386798 [Olea europaea var. sylvestris]